MIQLFGHKWKIACRFLQITEISQTVQYQPPGKELKTKNYKAPRPLINRTWVDKTLL